MSAISLVLISLFPLASEESMDDNVLELKDNVAMWKWDSTKQNIHVTSTLCHATVSRVIVLSRHENANTNICFEPKTCINSSNFVVLN